MVVTIEAPRVLMEAGIVIGLGAAPRLAFWELQQDTNVIGCSSD